MILQLAALLAFLIFSSVLIKKRSLLSLGGVYCLYVLALYFYYAFVYNFVAGSRVVSFTGFSLSAMPVKDWTNVNFETTIIMFSMFLVSFLGTLSASKNLTKNKERESLTNDSILKINRAFFAEYKIGLIGKKSCAIYFSLVLTFALLSYHFYNIDFDVLYRSYEYQSIKDPVSIGLDKGVLRFLHLTFRFIGLVCIVSIFICIKNKLYPHAVIALTIVAYCAFLLLVGNSRWIFVYMIAASLCCYVINKNKYLSLCFGVVGFFLLAKVMVGRGFNYQGVSALGDQFDYLFDLNILKVVLFSLGNLFEGGMNIANSLLLKEKHYYLYKLLSFSPLPSAIDQFSQIRSVAEIRISRHVPMGGVAESYHFGKTYFLFFMLICFLFFRKIEEVRLLCNKYVYFFFLVPSLYVMINFYSYSVRTTWKIFLAILIVSFLITFFKKKSGNIMED